MGKIAFDDKSLDKHADVLEQIAAHYRNIIDSLSAPGSRIVQLFNSTGYHQKQATAYNSWLQSSFTSLEQEIDRLNRTALYFRNLAQKVRDEEALFS
jgi:hypothetical protein